MALDGALSGPQVPVWSGPLAYGGPSCSTKVLGFLRANCSSCARCDTASASCEMLTRAGAVRVRVRSVVPAIDTRNHNNAYEGEALVVQHWHAARSWSWAGSASRCRHGGCRARVAVPWSSIVVAAAAKSDASWEQLLKAHAPAWLSQTLVPSNVTATISTWRRHNKTERERERERERETDAEDE